MRKERVRERIFYFTWWWALQQPDPILKLVIFPEATTTQLLEKRSPKLLHRITVLPLILTMSKIIKFVYLSSAQENKNRFLEADIVRNKWWQTPWWWSRKKRFTRKQKNCENQSYLFSSHFHRRGNFYCNPYSTQGGERRYQGEQLHFSLSTPLYIPFHEEETDVSKQSGLGDWLMGHWTLESATRPSSCFSSICRWSPFSCQLLSFPGEIMGFAVLSVPSQQVQLGRSQILLLPIFLSVPPVTGCAEQSYHLLGLFLVQVQITILHCKFRPIYSCQD